MVFKHLESPSQKDDFCQIWLKRAQWIIKVTQTLIEFISHSSLAPLTIILKKKMFPERSHFEIYRFETNKFTKNTFPTTKLSLFKIQPQ